MKDNEISVVGLNNIEHLTIISLYTILSQIIEKNEMSINAPVVIKINEFIMLIQKIESMQNVESMHNIYCVDEEENIIAPPFDDILVIEPFAFVEEEEIDKN